MIQGAGKSYCACTPLPDHRLDRRLETEAKSHFDLTISPNLAHSHVYDAMDKSNSIQLGLRKNSQ